MQKKQALKAQTKRSIHSFRPHEYSVPKLLHFRGDGAKDIGFDETTFPPLDEQIKWNRDTYEDVIGKAFNWYALAQDDKKALDYALLALGQGNDRRKIADKIRKSSIRLDRTSCWLLRMAHLGLHLSWRNKKFLAARIKEVLTTTPESQTITAPDAEAQTESKPNIQDRIEAKIRLTLGHVHQAFDEALANNFKTQHQVMQILLNPEVAPPGNRCKDLIRAVEPIVNELKLVQTGKDTELSEAYNCYGRRGVQRMIDWWEQAISDFNSYGLLKKNARKPRKRKTTTPDKIVSKLKFTKENSALKLKSVDPRLILQSTVLWVYNVRTRKLGVYIADKRSSALDVRSTRILNFDVIASVQKTLRKPEVQLGQFAPLGKPAAQKWFEGIKATEIKMKAALNKDCILIKVFK